METLTLEEKSALYKMIVETGHVSDKAIYNRLVKMGCIEKGTMVVTEYGHRLVMTGQ